MNLGIGRANRTQRERERGLAALCHLLLHRFENLGLDKIAPVHGQTRQQGRQASIVLPIPNRLERVPLRTEVKMCATFGARCSICSRGHRRCRIDRTVGQDDPVLAVSRPCRNITAFNVEQHAFWLAFQGRAAAATPRRMDVDHIAGLRDEDIGIAEHFLFRRAGIENEVRRLGSLAAERAPRPEAAAIAVTNCDAGIRREDLEFQRRWRGHRASGRGRRNRARARNARSARAPRSR